MNSEKGLHHKVLWMIFTLFVLLVIGMLVFAYLKQLEISESTTVEINVVR